MIFDPPKADRRQSACHHLVASEYILIPLFRRNQSESARLFLAVVQLGRHLEKGQNTIIRCQVICIFCWSRKMPPIKRTELRVFGRLFLAVKLQAVNEEIQIHPYDLSYATSWHLAAPNLLSKESFHIERLIVFKHKVNGAAQLMGEDSQGFALVVFSGIFGHEVFSLL